MRLAIVCSHPIQYYSPWFRYLAANGCGALRVFYLWDGGVTEQLDHGFGVNVNGTSPCSKAMTTSLCRAGRGFRERDTGAVSTIRRSASG